jgi:mannitol-specific phosphotransferase system IIBC component
MINKKKFSNILLGVFIGICISFIASMILISTIREKNHYSVKYDFTCLETLNKNFTNCIKREYKGPYKNV